MQSFKILPKLYDFKKLIIVLGVVFSSFLYPKAYAENSTLAAIPKLELGQYLGLWYEIARKPNVFSKRL